jgi:cytochrome c oxidase assembly factor CtaG
MRFLPAALGIVTFWIAVASPLAHLDHHLLTAHMVKHLVLMNLSAPLILLGMRPVIPAYGLRQPPAFIRWLKRVLTHPAFCWLAGTVTVIVWHVPAVFELALRSHFWHDFEHASFLAAGILFWWPVIGPTAAIAEGWRIPLYLFFATLPCDALSAFLTFCGHVVYRPYLSMGGHSVLSPLADQSLAGALMWVVVTFAYLIPALVVTARLLSGEEGRFVLSP